MLEYEKNLANYVPQTPATKHVTLTYAQSLDSKISQGRGLRTALSHAETKEMTQYLRTRHQGILIGSGTVMSDDPGLNCKRGLEYSPRPIIVDPYFKFQKKFDSSKIRSLFVNKLGKSPIFVITEDSYNKNLNFLNEKSQLGELEVLVISTDAEASEGKSKMDWQVIFDRLDTEFGIKSIMVEGGAYVINELLSSYPELIASVVITLAPVYLGDQGVTVHPSAGRVDLKNVHNFTGIRDVVICGNIAPNE